MTDQHSRIGRRALVVSGAVAAVAGLTRSTWMPAGAGAPAGAGSTGAARTAADPTRRSLASLDPKLLQRALTALDHHAEAVKHRDRVGIVDFSAPSAKARLHVLDLAGGKAAPFLVAHGSGSDPGHTGFLHSFSNVEGSNASSEGAFVTADYYVGKHGRSQRLRGLDSTNCNALDRAIVIHGAWYADAGMIRSHGKLGRSQGCFAVGERELADVFALLGEGRLIFAAKA